MRSKTRSLVFGALIAALYVVLTQLQNMLFPASASMAVQFRLSEALCVLALFTPSAIAGLSIGCLLFDLISGAALPLDFLIGSLATAGAALCMRKLRRVTLKGYPLPAMLMPAVWNGVLVGAELSIYVGGAFWLNAVCVALGEAGVLLSAGTVVFYSVKKHLPHLKL